MIAANWNEYSQKHVDGINQRGRGKNENFRRDFLVFFHLRPSCECIRWWLKWQVTRPPLPLVNKERKYSVRFECRCTSHRVIGWNRIALARFDHFRTIYLLTTLNFDCIDFNDIKINWRWSIFRKSKWIPFKVDWIKCNWGSTVKWISANLIQFLSRVAMATHEEAGRSPWRRTEMKLPLSTNQLIDTRVTIPCASDM